MKIRGDLYGAPSIRALKAIMTQTIILEAMEGVAGHAPFSHISRTKRAVCCPGSPHGLPQAGGLLWLLSAHSRSSRFRAEQG